MQTKMTKNGVTTTNNLGQEQYENFKGFGGRKLVQYDYRHTDGQLFSTVKDSLDKCREARDKWLEKKAI